MGLLSSLNLPRPRDWPAAAVVAEATGQPKTPKAALGTDDPDADGPSKVRTSSGDVPAPPGSPGAIIKPSPVIGITDSQGVETTKDGARPIAVKVEPKDLKARLDARDKALRDAYAKLAKAQAKLEEEIPKRSGDTKATMQAQKADIDKAIGNIDRQLKQVDADRKAINNPATDARTMNDIVARAKSPEPIGKAVEVDKHDGPLEKSPLKKQTTTTTTEVKDGTSTTTVNDRSVSAGPGGITKKQVDSTEQVSATGKTTSETSKTTTVGKDGLSHERVDKNSVETKGQTTSTENKTKVDVGLGGAGVNVEQKKTSADGSSKTTAAGVKGERGDGNLGVTSTASQSRTDAEGNTKKGGVTTKGGVTSKDGGVGAYGGGEGSLERKGSKGMATGVVGGLDAAISCNVKPVPGEVPPKYEVSIRVNLGASIKASGGYDKEGGSGKAGATVSGGATVWMQNSYRLEEAEAQAFVAALHKGGIGGGSQRELAIVRIGLSKGWPEAQRVFLGMPVGSAADVDGMKVGDKKSIGRKTSVGAGVNAESGGAGVNAAIERTDEREMTVSKGTDGSANYDTSQGGADKRSGGVKVSSGVVSGGFGIGKTVTTKTGYKFCVKPDMKNARELQDQIARLANASQAEVDAFAKAHPETVVERRDVKDKSKETTASVGVAGVDLSFSDGHGVEDTVRRDAQGNIIGTEKRGHNEGGLKLKAGKYQVGTDIKEEAKPRDDAVGDQVMDVTRQQTDTDAVKFLDSLPVVGTKKKSKDKGALATATGAEDEEDKTSTSVAGITLSESDLKALVGLAGNRAKWNNACISWGRDIDDWSKAAAKIAKAGNDPQAVKNALAEFVGGDSMRKEVVLRAVRPNAESKSASQWEFPESIKGIQQSYMDNAVAESQKRVVEAGKKDPAKGEAMANDLLQELERLDRVVRSATDFKETSTQAEMKSTIASRITKVQIERRKLQGVDQATAEKEQELPEFQRLFDNCVRYQQTESDLYAKVEAEFKKKLSNADPIVIAGLTVELKKLYARWTPDYEKMATFAQKNNRQKDNYFKFRPDTKRLQHVIQTGKAGEATGPTPDTVDRTKPPAPVRSAEEVKAESEANWKKYNQIKDELKATSGEVTRLANELKSLYATKPLAQAEKLFNQANVPVSDADRAYKGIRLDHMQDVFGAGPGALQKYREGLALLRKARALYPK
jgi:hypothetical protein